jgi:hypothetical protein
MCHAVTGVGTKLACAKQASFFNVSSDYCYKNFLKQLAHCGQEANCMGILGS